MLNKLRTLIRLWKLIPTKSPSRWEPDDVARFSIFLRSGTGKRFASNLRRLIFSESQRQCIGIDHSAEWRVGFACGIQSAVTYIDQMGTVLENEDEDHDN